MQPQDDYRQRIWIRNNMKPDYKSKKIQVIIAYCPACKEKLEGNNSVQHPWQCKCGIWKWSYVNQEHYINK